MPFKEGEIPEGATPFEKGESGNPNGRPVGSKNRSTLLRKWLEVPAKIINPETKEETIGTVEDRIIMALITKAAKGDVIAMKEIQDTIYGKIPQKIDATIGSSKEDLKNIFPTDEELNEAENQ